MPIVYQTSDKMLHQPEKEKNQLHEYHDDIRERVDCEVIGTTGKGSAIRTISLAKECDISSLENWLGFELTKSPDE